MKMENNIIYLNIEDIIPNRFQPRLNFDEDALKELAISIKEHGIIQPLVVRRLANDRYEIIAGERRYKASQIAGLDKVPVIIANLDDNESAEVALIENLQRKDLSAIEEAKSYKKLLERGYLTQDLLAQRLGVSQSSIANKVRLLNLTNEVQDALMRELISERHARSLLQLSNPEEQIKMLNRIIENRMTVRQLDNEISNLLNKNQAVNQYDFIEQKTFSDLDTLDFNEVIQNKSDFAEKLINDSKEQIEKQYETFNIPTGEEVKESPKNTTYSKEIKIEPGNLNSFISKIKEIEKEAKTAGFDIETEDYDFEDLYQIIIKIEK